jgi:hypothetical protein
VRQIVANRLSYNLEASTKNNGKDCLGPLDAFRPFLPPLSSLVVGMSPSALENHVLSKTAHRRIVHN